VGVYLPLSSTLRCTWVAWCASGDKIYRRPADAEDEQQGTLYSSG
jgi:hypothetical protein